MKAVFNKKEEIVGYEIGENILIHNHIGDPETWFLTIRILSIFGEVLCSKKHNTQEIARFINLKLNKELLIRENLTKEVIPFT